MKKHYFFSRFQLLSFSIFFLIPGSIYAQKYGAVYGRLTDAVSGESLFFASVVVDATFQGGSTDIEGKYRIDGIKPGSHLLNCSYLGYRDKKIPVEIVAGQSVEINVQLEPDVQEMEEIVITSQALGQTAAINQQIKANTIMSVVSMERIRELPDQNAAETLGRLPGVSVLRANGEGQNVVVRGISPRLNSITVNGERIPSTDIQDRSVDLSMISADALSGIELYKALTPDLDGDAVGGTVNFKVKKAPDQRFINLRGFWGYNNHENDYGNLRASAALGQRFANNKLGIILNGNYQRANRSSDGLVGDLSYRAVDQEGRAILGFDNFNLADRIETRYRYGGSGVIDYRLDRGEIVFNTIYSATNREEIRRRRRYRVAAQYQEYDIRYRERDTDLFSNILSGDHTLGRDFELHWRSSLSVTNQTTPYSVQSRFRELGAFSSYDEGNLESIINAAKNNLDETHLKDVRNDDTNVNTRNYTLQFDLKKPFQIKRDIGVYLKFGAKMRHDERERDVRQLWTSAFGTDHIAERYPERWDLDSRGRIRMSNYIGNFFADDFASGEYYLGPGPGEVNGPHMDEALSNQWFEDYKTEPEFVNNPEADQGDYRTRERVYAAYMMGEFNIKKLTLLAGVRNEYTQGDYFSKIGSSVPDDDDDGTQVTTKDTATVNNYNSTLPMVHLRYKFTKWFDVRIAYTESINRPNYLSLSPFRQRNTTDQRINQGNSNLKNTKARNYDIFLSFYNKIGLFTLGGFYKQIDNIDYIRRSIIVDGDPRLLGWDLIQPENSIGTSEVKGIEIDLQMRFTFLPTPFSGIVLSTNASFIDSKTFYPFSRVERNPTRLIKDTRVGTMVGQPDKIFNFSIGYDLGGFSGRFSVLHQGSYLGVGGAEPSNPGGFRIDVATRSELDAYTAGTTRLDLSLSQRIGDAVKLYFNMNNLSNAIEQEFNGSDYETRREEFGWTAELGIQLQFE